MAPLPDNNTMRMFLGYTSMEANHEIVFRFGAGVSTADAAAEVAAFAAVAKALLPTTDSFARLRSQAAGSNVSFPVMWTTVAGTYGGGGAEDDDRAKFLSATGRSLDGRDVKITLFTPATSDATGYRLLRASGNNADILLDAIEAMEPGPVSISGGAVIWNQYANVGYNAYWQREARKHVG